MARMRGTPGRGRKIKALVARLEKFLAEERIDPDYNERKAGEEQVRDADVIELYELFRRIVGLKFQADMDGDVPIHVVVTDETRYCSPGWLQVPHLHREDVTWNEHVSIRLANLSMAANAMSNCQNTFTHKIFRSERQAVREAAPRPRTKRFLGWLESMVLVKNEDPDAKVKVGCKEFSLADLQKVVDENKNLWEDR